MEEPGLFTEQQQRSIGSDRSSWDRSDVLDQGKWGDSSVANQGSLKNVENRLGYATPDREGHRCTPV